MRNKNTHIADPETLETLFREHYKLLCHAAYLILTDAEAARDIVQEFFCYCWNKRNEIGPIHDFRNYSNRAVRNACINYLKQARRKVPYNDFSRQASTPGEIPDREEQQDQKAREQALWSTIGRLPEQRRIIFLLSNKDGLSYTQIATRLNLSVNTVKTQIRLAYQFLREECRWILQMSVLFLLAKYMTMASPFFLHHLPLCRLFLCNALWI